MPLATTVPRAWRGDTISHNDTTGNQAINIMSDNETAFHKAILKNQAEILKNQQTIKKNQQDIKANQKKLDQILANQKAILANQKKILSK